MTHLITFTTSQFDASVEVPNPINPIAGESVLKWLQEKLAASSYDATNPEAEDWGWYIYVNGRGASYLVGASSDVDQAPLREWVVQIHWQRSLRDKLFGRNKLADDDALSAFIERIIREGIGAQYVHSIGKFIFWSSKAPMNQG